MTAFLRSRLGVLPLAALLLVALPACDSGGDEDDGEQMTDDVIFQGLNFTRLFDAPTAAEIQSVQADWAGRSPNAQNATVVSQASVDGATLYVVSHTVAEGPGAPLTHYGLVRVPDGATDAPVLVVHHGGDSGFGVNDPGGNTGVAAQAALYPDLYANTVQVFPTYRSEDLRLDGSDLDCGDGSTTCTSGGMPSPWDYDVDDTMALLSSVTSLPEFEASTDDTNVGALGYSRGANTAVLHAIRDSRIDAVTEYYGPTDFYNPVVTALSPPGLTAALLLGVDGVENLPGAMYLRDEVIFPLRNADNSYNAGADYAGARLEVVRRSASVFAASIPDLQVHHHVEDPVVPYGFSQAFDAAITATPNDGTYDFNEYSNALPSGVTSAHRPEAMPASWPDTEAFLLGILSPPTVRTPALAFAD